MSLLENIKSRFTADRSAALTLGDALREAEAEVTRLEAQRGTYALALANGEADAATSMAAWRRNLADAQTTVADLKAAVEAQRERDKLAERARTADTRQTHIRSLKAKLAEQQKHLARLAAAAENLSGEWRATIDAARDIGMTLNAAGLDAPPWLALQHPGALRDLLLVELWRHNQTASIAPGNVFPAALPGVQEAEMKRLGFAVQHGWHDLEAGVRAQAVGLVERLDQQRKVLIDAITAAPLPPVGATLPKELPTLPAPKVAPTEPTKKVPIEDFTFPRDAPKPENRVTGAPDETYITDKDRKAARERGRLADQRAKDRLALLAAAEADAKERVK